LKKHFLIIGGTRGIGRVIAHSFAHDGHHVSAIGQKLSLLPSKAYSKIHHYLSDISDKKKREKIISKIISENGRISHIIFCQRYRGSDDDWTGELEVSLTATKDIIEMTSSFFDDTKERSIVVISSIADHFIATDQPLSYHVGKAGLSQLVRYLAVSLSPKGIRINCISPATVIKQEAKEYYEKQKLLIDLYQHLIPLGRTGTPQDIAGVASFLCSPQSGFITGQNIIVDGGLSLLAQESLTKKLVTFMQKKYEKK
jgi:NAD(P)-dependent dehydrogenase (short-subunit alcohol dehydrogenase family)